VLFSSLRIIHLNMRVVARFQTEALGAGLGLPTMMIGSLWTTLMEIKRVLTYAV
jgi:hypothetical protein